MSNIYNKNKNFIKLNSVLSKIFVDLGLERRLNEVAFFNYWPEVVGSKFDKDSKAIMVRKRECYDILIVAVSSSVVAQELYLYKQSLVHKVYKTGKSFNFNIKDIHFNTKLWDNDDFLENKSDKKPESAIKTFDKIPLSKDLDDITLPESIIKDIEKSMEGHKFVDSEQRKKMFMTIIKDVKTQIWMKNNGFPCCEECGIPLKRYNTIKERILCVPCKLLSSSL